MSVDRRYVLDANAFIEAHQKYYAFDICPGFWSALLRQNKSSRICSIDRIKSEIEVLNDDLKKWAKEAAPGTFFKGTADKKVSDTYGEMVTWVQNERQFTPQAKAEFASVADGWVIAYAKANDLVVVTHEEYAPEVRKKVPIPNVCIEYDVEYCSTFGMLKALKEKFVLKTRRRAK